MGDQYIAYGQTGAIGPNARAHDIQFAQWWQAPSEKRDVEALQADLAKLRRAMKAEATTLEHDAAVGALAMAEDALQKQEHGNLGGYLAKSGRWALGLAERIGTQVAAAAIKASLGL